MAEDGREQEGDGWTELTLLLTLDGRREPTLELMPLTHWRPLKGARASTVPWG